MWYIASLCAKTECGRDPMNTGIRGGTRVSTRQKTMRPGFVAQQMKRHDAGPYSVLPRMSAAERFPQEEKQEKELEKS